MAIIRVLTPFYWCSFGVETTNFLEVSTPNENISPLAKRHKKRAHIQREHALFEELLFTPTDAEKFIAGLVSLIDNTVDTTNGVN